MSDTKSQQEPSMEEIVASIRRIISEDTEPAEPSKPGPAPAPSAPAPVSAYAPPPPALEPMDEDVLELTQMVQDDGSVVDVDDPQDDDPWARAMEPEPAPDPEPDPEPPLSLETLDDLFDRPVSRPQPVHSYDDDD